MVNKRMVIPLLSHLGWSFLCVLFRAMARVSFLYFYATLYVVFVFSFSSASLCARVLSGLCWRPQDYATVLIFCDVFL